MGIRVHANKRGERKSVLKAIGSLKRALLIPDVAGIQDSYESTVKASGLVRGFFAPLREEFSSSMNDGAVYRIYTPDAESAELLGNLLHSASLSGLRPGRMNSATIMENEIKDRGFQLSIFIQSGRETRFLSEIEKLIKRLIAPTKPVYQR